MAKRRPKPPGQEHWTWREIEAGRKMSRGQRSAARRWEHVSAGGPGWQAVYILILAIGVVLAILARSR